MGSRVFIFKVIMRDSGWLAEATLLWHLCSHML